MMTLTLQVHDVADRWPDADTDVLIFDPAHPQAQLGAYMGHDVDGAPIWVDAQGGEVVGVTRWADLPVLAC